MESIKKIGLILVVAALGLLSYIAINKHFSKNTSDKVIIQTTHDQCMNDCWSKNKCIDECGVKNTYNTKTKKYGQTATKDGTKSCTDCRAKRTSCQNQCTK